jgi:hypothetical protein
MEARKNAPATPAKTQGTPVTLQFSNAPKKQMNPYAKAPMPEKSIERYDVERNRIFTLVMDDNGRYVENGTSRTLNKETEKKSDPLENVNMEDLDGISQPGYCYELNKQKRESEEGENNSNNNKKVDGKPLAKPPEEITTTENPNLFSNMDNTQEFTPPTQNTDNNETHTLADDDEKSDDRYTLFLTELNKVIETRVDNNVKPQMDKCLATITKLIEDKIGAATATNTVDGVFANPITPTMRTPTTFHQRDPQHPTVSFSNINSLQYIPSPYHPPGTQNVPCQTPSIIGLDRTSDQEPVKLSGKDDKVQHIREDLESQHHQLQPLVINLARVSLLATKDINLKLKKLGIMTQRDSNGDPLHIPKSTQCNTTYNIPEVLEQEENLQDQKAKIDRIAKEATIQLAIAMTEAVRMEIQHMWRLRVNTVIDEIIKIAKHITRQIEKNENTDETWLGAPEGLKPFYCIVHFASELDKDKTSNFLQNYIKENEKQFIDKVGIKFNITDVSHHLQVIACKALISKNAKRHLNTAAAWLLATIIPATVKIKKYVEEELRAKEIENEITVETKARSINTATKAVADALIKTVETHPTDIQGNRIAALVAKEVKAELKRESAKKEKGRQRTGPTQSAFFVTQAQKKRQKRMAHQPERNTEWNCPAGFPPTAQNATEYNPQRWQQQETNTYWSPEPQYTIPSQPPQQQPTQPYHLPLTQTPTQHQAPHERREHQPRRGRGLSERGRGRTSRVRGRMRGRGRQNPQGRRGGRGRDFNPHQSY